MNVRLTPYEARVLGCLIEKEVATPEYYPLSLNAIVNAANQKSNRDPVMNLDEDSALAALHSLDAQGLARSAATDGRVPKYEHRLQESFNFHRHEMALVCVLLLRGPQTPGELRARTDRLYSFDDLAAVHSALNLLMHRVPPLVQLLPRQPGAKESRYAELLSATVPDRIDATSSGATTGSVVGKSNTDLPLSNDRLANLEAEVAALKDEITHLKMQVRAISPPK